MEMKYWYLPVSAEDEFIETLPKCFLNKRICQKLEIGETYA